MYFRMKQATKYLLLALLALSMLPAGGALAANAPYDTRTPYVGGGMSKTKDAYLPVKTIEKFGEKDLKTPGDIALSPDGYLYIADTGNGRVLKVAKDGTLAAEIGKGQLKFPKGVFVSHDNQVYVADSRGKAVFLFDASGSLIRQYTKPDAVLYGRDADFTPSKVAADRAGNVYIISEGNSGGVIQLSREGDFFGYVGANKTPLSLDEIIRRLLFTSEQQAQLKLNVPVAPINLAIDARGLIYTVTQGGANDALKKFNMAGVNMFKETSVDALVADVCLSAIGNIYTVSTDGYIAEYTTDGEFLYLFGGRDDGYNRNGLFVAAAGIAVDDTGYLYVLDSERKSVTVFAPTEYASTVHTALKLYQEGQYVQSQVPWESALSQDAMFSLAYRGIGEAYYKQEQYEKAMHAFREGYAYTGYSESYWETRNAWLMQNLALVFLWMVGLYAAAKLLGAANRRYGWLAPAGRALRRLSGIPILRKVAYMARVPKNPADAFYGIRHENKVSVVSSTVVYLLFFLVFLMGKYWTAFLFKTVPDGYFEIGRDFLTVFGVIALSAVSCNLICSISDGEARLKDVYCSLAYCLMPFIFLKPILTLVSHGLTNNEAFIMQIGDFFIAASIAVLVLVMVKEIQAYSFKKTLWCLLLTFFTMALIFITGVIAMILVNQVVDFVSSVFREVYFRAG